MNSCMRIYRHRLQSCLLLVPRLWSSKGLWPKGARNRALQPLKHRPAWNRWMKMPNEAGTTGRLVFHHRPNVVEDFWLPCYLVMWSFTKDSEAKLQSRILQLVPRKLYSRCQARAREKRSL